MMARANDADRLSRPAAVVAVFGAAVLHSPVVWALPRIESVEGLVHGVLEAGELCSMVVSCLVVVAHGIDRWFLEAAESAGHVCPNLTGMGFAFLAMVAFVIVGLARLRLVLEQRRLDLVRRLVEEGHDVPEDLLRGSARSDLRRGIVLVASSVGFLATAWLTGEGRLASLGLIPTFIGVGYLLSYRIASRTGGDGRG